MVALFCTFLLGFLTLVGLGTYCLLKNSGPAKKVGRKGSVKEDYKEEVEEKQKVEEPPRVKLPLSGR